MKERKRVSAPGARPRKAAPRHYHHGNLHAALVKAARAMMEEDGAALISLRAVAAAAGVSPNAPYHHFADKAALMAAVAEDGFREFRERVLARGAGEGDAAKRLRKLAVGYVEFAVRAPGVFRLMFGPKLHHQNAPGVAAGAAASAALLRDAVRQCLPGASESKVRSASVAAWSLVHGLAVLCHDGRVNVRGARDLERRVMAVTAHFDALGAD